MDEKFGKKHNEMLEEERFEEEVGAEIAPPLSDQQRPARLRRDDDADAPEEREGSGLGIAALVLSILSLLFLPFVLGIAGIIVGFMAFRRGSRGLGLWAIGLGALSVIGSLFLAPFFG